MTYTCDKCSKKFAKKTDYVRHKNKKLPCDGSDIKDLIEEKVEEIVAKRLEERLENKNVGVIMNLVRTLHDIMRSKATIIGQKAYYDIVRLLLLRFMEPHITPGGKLAGLLNPANYTGINGFIPDHMKYLSFSNLVKTLDMDFEEKIYLVWDMLGNYEATKGIFPKKQTFNGHPTVLELACRHIYKAMENIHFDEINEDIGGAIYEHFVNEKGGGGGKSLGQFFTPRRLIHLINKLNLEVFPDNKPKTIYDPCAGTGGFIMEMIKTAKVAPDDIYGGELEPDTFASCLMNMMLTTGTMTNIRNVDSFKNNSSQLYDWIGTNPPFGMKGLDYQSILDNSEFKPSPVKKGTQNVRSCIPTNEMYPIKTNDGSALFLQHCIAKLAINGMCNIVLPAGQLLTGKNAYAKIRQHLIQECTLKAVLAVPSGTFEHAGVSTVVLFFTKLAKSCTGDVDFYETAKTCESFKKLGTVHYDDLASKNYVLDWKYYKQNEVFKPIDSTWEMKTLGEVCEFVNGKKHNVSEGADVGTYELLCSSTQGKVKYLETYDYEGPYVAVGTGGAANIHLKNKFSISTDFKVIKLVNESVSLNYLFIYLKSIINEIDEMFKGSGIKHLDMDQFKAIQIPIPSLEKQQEIITRCEEYDLDIQSNSTLIGSLEASKATITKTYVKPLFKSKDVKTLGEVCEIKAGKMTTESSKEDGIYPLYTGSYQNPSKQHDSYCFDGDKYIILTKDGGSGKETYGKEIGLGMTYLVSGKSAATSGQLMLKINNETINIIYMYYYLQSKKNEIMDLAKYGANASLGHISIDSIKEIQIPVPSLEKQQEIIAKYEAYLLKLKQQDETIHMYELCNEEIQNFKKELFH